MAVTLKDTFKPFLHILQDISRTFTPYLDKPKESEVYYQASDLLHITRLKKKYRQEYFDNSVWGDVAQLPRGLVNMAKGLGRIVRGICKLFPPVFLIIWLHERFASKYLVYSNEEMGTAYVPFVLWLSFKEVGKGLLYDLTNGLGILLRGAVQVVATPLLLIRIPLRIAITYKMLTDAVENKKEIQALVVRAKNEVSDRYEVIKEIHKKYKEEIQNGGRSLIDPSCEKKLYNDYKYHKPNSALNVEQERTAYLAIFSQKMESKITSTGEETKLKQNQGKW